MDNIRNLDEFNTIIKESQNKYEKYKNNLNYKEMHYYNDFKDDTTTLFYIHGKGSNIEEALMECKALVGNLKLNFIIPQSKEPYLNNQFCWDDKASAIETLSSRLEKLETSHFILAGKSQGARVALDLFCDNKDLNNLMLIMPAIYDNSNIEEVVQKLKKYSNKRIYIYTGDNDFYRIKVEEFSRILINNDINCKIKIIENCRHYFPYNEYNDFQEAFKYLLINKGI